MDSGNSGSMQSSSGPDEEYDSISSFLNPSAHFVSSISDIPKAPAPAAAAPPPPTPPLPPLFPHQLSLFNPHSQNLDAFSQSLSNNIPKGNPTPQYPNDLVCFKGLTGLSSSSFSSSSQSVIGVQGPHSQSHQPNIAPKNPRKRTRASRRAPTTVVTTDTTNFRQLVQEFTGIPTAPFSGTPPYSSSLDLFSTGHHLDSLKTLYSLRSASSAQQVQLSNAVAPSSDLGRQKQPQNLMNMQNQMLSFQTLLQASSQANTSVPSYDELGLGHENHVNANLSGFPLTSASFDGNKVNSDQQHLTTYNKFNCSGSTSEFHHDNAFENATSGGEGTVASWICPSD